MRGRRRGGKTPRWRREKEVHKLYFGECNLHRAFFHSSLSVLPGEEDRDREVVCKWWAESYYGVEDSEDYYRWEEKV